MVGETGLEDLLGVAAGDVDTVTVAVLALLLVTAPEAVAIGVNVVVGELVVVRVLADVADTDAATDFVGVRDAANDLEVYAGQ